MLLLQFTNLRIENAIIVLRSIGSTYALTNELWIWEGNERGDAGSVLAGRVTRYSTLESSLLFHSLFELFKILTENFIEFLSMSTNQL